LINPVLTPSLNVVNQVELDDLYKNNKEHSFLKKIKDSSSYDFYEMKNIIKIKDKIQKMLDYPSLFPKVNYYRHLN